MNVGINLEFEQPAGMPARDQADARRHLVERGHGQGAQQRVRRGDAAAARGGAAVGVRSRDAAARQPARRSTCRRSPASRSTTCRSRRSTTAQDDFLALYASLGAEQADAQLGGADDPFVARRGRTRSTPSRRRRTAPSDGRAQLAQRRRRPTPAMRPRRALARRRRRAARGRRSTSIATTPAAASSSGAYNLNGGMWRPYQPRRPARRSATARSRGRASTTIGLKSRVKGDYRTVSDDDRDAGRDRLGRPAHLPRQGDVGRRHATRSRCGTSSAAATSQYAFGKPGDDEPEIDVGPGRRRVAARARRCSASTPSDGEIVVFAKDELGNQTIALDRAVPRPGGRVGLQLRDAAGRPGRRRPRAVRSRRPRCSFGRRRASRDAPRARPRAVATTRSRSWRRHVGRCSSLRPRLQLRQLRRRSRARPPRTAAPTSAPRASCRSASTTRACAPTTSRRAASVRTPTSRSAPTARSGSRRTRSRTATSSSRRRRAGPHPRRGVGVGRRRARRSGRRPRLEDPRRHRRARAPTSACTRASRSRRTARRW